VWKQAAARQTSSIDRIYSLERFKAEFAHPVSNDSELSDSDFDVLLTFLRREKGVIAYDGKVGAVLNTI
jgi:charged multivesicular body protein 7